MVIKGRELEQLLKEFEENTEGIMGTSIIDTNQALMIAEASSEIERMMVQAMSERLMQMSHKVLEGLIKNYTLLKVMIEEENHFIFLRPIDVDYYLVVITKKMEALGIVEFNMKKLIENLRNSMNSD